MGILEDISREPNLRRGGVHAADPEMKRKPIALFIALLSLLGTTIFVQRNSDPSPSGGQTATGQTAITGASGINHPSQDPQGRPDAATARRLSPEGWIPPEAFAATASPAPQIPFPHGENAQRRHAEPVTHEIPRDLGARTPSVLTKTPEDGRLHLLPEEIDLHTRLARRMVFDPSALDRIINGGTARVIAPTTGDELLMLQFHTRKTRSAHSHTLLGRVVGEEETSDVIVVYHDGVIHGQLVRYTTDQHLEYRILADGHMMVRELEPATMTARCGNGPHTEMADELFEAASMEGFEIITQGDGQESGDTPGWRTIDIVVGYDQGARVDDGGYAQIEARIIASVDRTTQAYANSLIPNTELMLLGTIEDPEYVFPGWTSGSQSDELNALRTLGNGRLDAVTGYYTLLGADLIAFIPRSTDGSAGLASRPGFASVTARTYMATTRITFAHEIGHNLGCDHSWGDSSQAYHSHYGWRLDPPGTARVRTIMAYDWGWTRIPYFANPSVSFNRAATGAVNGYNVLGDLTADQRYYRGGMGYSGSNTNRSGFDGTNPGLGARSANTINTGGGNSNFGATRAANRHTRTNFNVISPAEGSEWTSGEAGIVHFTGGDMQNRASIRLYKNGTFHTTIAANLNPATQRDFTWEIPESIPPGNDYMIRVTLDPDSITPITADSGIFSITGDSLMVVAQSPDAATPVAGPLSHVSLTFSHPVDPTSFSAADGGILAFTGPSGRRIPANTITSSWSGGNTVLNLDFPSETTIGSYRIVITSEVADAYGNLLDQNANGIPGEPYDDRFVGTFQIEGAGPAETIWSDLVGTADADPGWTFSGVHPSWEIGTPAQSPPHGPAAAFDGGPIIAQNLAGHHNPNENSFAEPPVIDCTAYSDVSLSYHRWARANIGDQLYIDAWNGHSWQRVFQFTGSEGDSGDAEWTRHEIPLGTIAENNPDFRLRWGLVDEHQRTSPTEAGWQLDAIQVTGESNPPPPAPWVVAHHPRDLRTSPQDSIWLEFSQPMDPGGFTLGDVESFTGPGGPISPTGFEWTDSTTLRVDFPDQSATGQYTLVLTPNITDAGGRPLDQNFNGTPGEAAADGYTATFGINTPAIGGLLATGGDISLVNSHYIHTFTHGNDTFRVLGDSPLEVDVLVVAGGGGGGSATQFSTAGAGGGGAGGLVYQEGLILSGSTLASIGSGGAAAGTGNTTGGNGENTTFGTITAIGRGGGSGGGGRGASGGDALQPSSPSAGHGHAGATWPSAGGDGAGGGGGAGGLAPAPPPANVGGSGDPGRAYDITVTLIHYAGGGGGGGGNNNRVGAPGGSGTVIVRYPAFAPSAYGDWANRSFANPFLDVNPTANFDGGTLANALEWVLGGDPTDPGDDASILPTLDHHSDPDFIIFTHRRTAASAADENTSIAVEYGGGLDGWITAEHDQGGIIINVEKNGAAAGIDYVHVRIPRVHAASGSLFARLRVTVATDGA